MLSLPAPERKFIQQVVAVTPPSHAPDPTTISSNLRNGDSTPMLSRERILADLTHRELEVLHLLAQQRTDAEIAEALVITPATVKKHAGNIYRKMAVKNRRQAVARAQVSGILPLAQ
jgi:DNA-binding CsgD family transcriptional regulator